VDRVSGTVHSRINSVTYQSGKHVSGCDPAKRSWF